MTKRKPAPSPTLKDYLAEYELWLLTNYGRGRMHERGNEIYRLMEAYPGHVYPGDFTIGDIEDYREYLLSIGRSTDQVNREIRGVARFFEFLRTTMYVNLPNPAKLKPYPRVYGHKKSLRAEELRRLLNECYDERLRSEVTGLILGYDPQSGLTPQYRNALFRKAAIRAGLSDLDWQSFSRALRYLLWPELLRNALSATPKGRLFPEWLSPVARIPTTLLPPAKRPVHAPSRTAHGHSPAPSCTDVGSKWPDTAPGTSPSAASGSRPLGPVA